MGDGVPNKPTDGKATPPELNACVWGVEGADDQADLDLVWWYGMVDGMVDVCDGYLAMVWYGMVLN